MSTKHQISLILITRNERFINQLDNSLWTSIYYYRIGFITIEKGLIPELGSGNGEVIALCSSGGGYNMAAGVIQWW